MKLRGWLADWQSFWQKCQIKNVFHNFTNGLKPKYEAKQLAAACRFYLAKYFATCCPESGLPAQ